LKTFVQCVVLVHVHPTVRIRFHSFWAKQVHWTSVASGSKRQKGMNPVYLHVKSCKNGGLTIAGLS